MRKEHLGGAFLGQFLQALAQLLGFQRILQAYASKQFGGKVRDTGKADLFALGKGIANLYGAMVVQTDDVTGPGFFQVLALGGKEGQGIGNAQFLAGSDMEEFHALFIVAGADTHEGNAVAVLGVHVRLDLEHKTTEARLARQNFTLMGRTWQRLGRPIDYGVQYLIDTEVAQCRAEEHRGHFALEKGLALEDVTSTLHQLELLDKTVVQIIQMGAGLIRIEVFDDALFGTLMAVSGLVDNDVVAFQVIHALEVPVAANRPGYRGGLDIQYRLDFIQQFDRVADITVKLVDEADNRRVAQPADIHQSNGAGLYALAAIQYHER